MEASSYRIPPGRRSSIGRTYRCPDRAASWRRTGSRDPGVRSTESWGPQSILEPAGPGATHARPHRTRVRSPAGRPPGSTGRARCLRARHRRPQSVPAGWVRFWCSFDGTGRRAVPASGAVWSLGWRRPRLPQAPRAPDLELPESGGTDAPFESRLGQKAESFVAVGLGG
ncbi:hypothetical protein NDU88_006151 [Pleurodeles waltl]|uniref:Uncharacterized protein n=1 Tax=Pleurodeles waltl TaxID=8319 RepID=A0AAV7SNS2_PLEWA|nr:hypothetical protein NDU88_006151 [Pleurodeles waltl]